MGVGFGVGVGVSSGSGSGSVSSGGSGSTGSSSVTCGALTAGVSCAKTAIVFIERSTSAAPTTIHFLHRFMKGIPSFKKIGGQPETAPVYTAKSGGKTRKRSHFPNIHIIALYEGENNRQIFEFFAKDL